MRAVVIPNVFINLVLLPVCLPQAEGRFRSNARIMQQVTIRLPIRPADRPELIPVLVLSGLKKIQITCTPKQPGNEFVTLYNEHPVD